MTARQATAGCRIIGGGIRLVVGAVVLTIQTVSCRRIVGVPVRCTGCIQRTREGMALNDHGQREQAGQQCPHQPHGPTCVRLRMVHEHTMSS